jgi:hypothetical protein
MIEYKNSKIYKITSNKTDMIYIGSTTLPLNHRLWKHKEKSNNTASKLILQIDRDAKIEVVEEFECENNKQKVEKEFFHINSFLKNGFNVINKHMMKGIQPCLEKNEYNKIYRDGNEELKQKKHEYYVLNSNKLTEQAKVNYQKRKDSLSEKITCECGCVIRKSDKPRHIKTKKHINVLYK